VLTSNARSQDKESYDELQEHPHLWSSVSATYIYEDESYYHCVPLYGFPVLRRSVHHTDCDLSRVNIP